MTGRLDECSSRGCPPSPHQSGVLAPPSEAFFPVYFKTCWYVQQRDQFQQQAANRGLKLVEHIQMDLLEFAVAASEAALET